MSKKENLYENLRKNGSDLRQTPSDRAWRRLENRLDGREGVQRTLGARRWIMAASVLILVGVMTGLLFMTESPNKMTALADSGRALLIEDLIYTDTEISDVPAVQLQKRIEQEDWQPINEGKAGRVLVAVHINKSPSKANQIQENQTPTTTKGNKSSNQFNKTKKQSEANFPMSEWMWLEGEWTVNEADKQNIENWTFNGTDEISNVNSLATDLQVPLIMGLQCRGNICELKMVVDHNGETQRFELLEKGANNYEFLNLGNAFPQKLVIEKTERTHFTMKISGGKIEKRQQNYLEQNGFIFSEANSAKRTLVKK